VNLKTQAMVEHLMIQGAIEMAGIDENGHMLYTITEKLEKVSPELYYELKQQYENYMFKLVKKGPITMNWRISV
jgi:hypothetical protein